MKPTTWKLSKTIELDNAKSDIYICMELTRILRDGDDITYCYDIEVAVELYNLFGNKTSLSRYNLLCIKDLEFDSCITNNKSVLLDILNNVSINKNKVLCNDTLEVTGIDLSEILNKANNFYDRISDISIKYKLKPNYIGVIIDVSSTQDFKSYGLEILYKDGKIMSKTNGGVAIVETLDNGLLYAIGASNEEVKVVDIDELDDTDDEE